MQRFISFALLATVIFAGCASTQVTKVAKSYEFERKTPRGIKADIGDARADNTPIYFEFDEQILSAASRTRLQAVAAYMAAHKGVYVTITGHADSRGTSEYNMALGDRRARSAAQYLATLGADSDYVRVVSYGEELPAVLGSDDSALALNRRDEFQFSTRLSQRY